ncbi:MAG: hypothetical protein JJ938_17590 [Roseicyclus sp.]|nr:hypothetical protein [Roseicyclus sp.]MBO6626690.1 hypothetical protein [Roseicyclus sp.]MBO6922354.1 hypothetical protein [Roseicyclus sp.]
MTEAVSEWINLALSIIAIGVLSGIWLRIGGMTEAVRSLHHRFDAIVARVNRIEEVFFHHKPKE